MSTQTLIQLLVPITLLVGAYFIGTSIEKKHFRELRMREHASRRFLTVTFPHEPQGEEIVDTTLVMGSVVISVDYFKRFIAGLRMIFGGRITAYEPILDRGAPRSHHANERRRPRPGLSRRDQRAARNVAHRELVPQQRGNGGHRDPRFRNRSQAQTTRVGRCVRFEPRLPRDDFNVTPRHPLKEGLVMLLGLVTIVGVALGASVLLVDRLVPYVPRAWESRMFPDFAGLAHRPETEGDRADQRRLEELLERLSTHWPEHPESLRRRPSRRRSPERPRLSWRPDPRHDRSDGRPRKRKRAGPSSLATSSDITKAETT